MSVKTVVGALLGFLGHHVTDLNNVADALGSIVGAVPIDPQDKEKITSVIEDLKASVDNINSFLNNTDVTAGDVTVKESDLVAAVSNYFSANPINVEGAVSTYLNTDAFKAELTAAVSSVVAAAHASDQVASTEGNANG